jgi:hypothetical protein
MNGVTNKPFILSVVMLNIVMLSVAMLNVVALFSYLFLDFQPSMVVLAVVTAASGSTRWQCYKTFLSVIYKILY